MLPSFLIPALFALGGVCILLCAYIFHYFKDRVDQYIIEKMSHFFATETTENFLQMIKEGKLPSTLMKDFTKELFQIGDPRRRLLRCLLFFPVAGGLLILSASLASIGVIENEFIISIADMLELLADLTLLLAFIMIAYSAYQLVKLARELA